MSPAGGEGLLDPAVLERLASLLPAAGAGGGRRDRGPGGVREARDEARAIVRELLAQPDYPRLLERHGLRFVCYLEGEWEHGSPPLIHVQCWDGEMWRNLAELRAER